MPYTNQLQQSPGSGANSPSAGSATQQSETEMFQSLMGEINRLKSELGLPAIRAQM